MFASLVLSSKGRPSSVWLGAAAAFLVHVVIAITVGVGLFHLLPQRAVEGVVAVLFLIGAALAFRESTKADEELVQEEVAAHGKTVTTAFRVIFIAEWGDLTQILTANLAAHYRSPFSVGIGATLALWAVAAIAVIGGRHCSGFSRSPPFDESPLPCWWHSRSPLRSLRRGEPVRIGTADVKAL